MAANGGSGGDDEVLSRIQQALEVVHSSFSANDARRQAQDFLEEVKDFAEAPFQGYNLASNKSYPAIIRHYALSLLEHAIRYRWSTYSDEQAQAIRDWVVQLGQAVASDDPSYLRNKTAQLWVEVAKRCWGAEWMDMDAMLAQLWQTADSSAHKELVLFVLETLSDEIFSGDDPVVTMREGVLSKACVEIFTPTAVLIEVFPNRQPGPDVRHGPEGWLGRLTEFLNYCIQSSPTSGPEVKVCATKTLSALLSLMPWAIPKAIAAAQCVDVLSAGLSSPLPEIQKGSLDALHALYARSNFTHEEFKDLVAPMFQPEAVQLCQNVFRYSAVDAEDIDDEKYQILKKLSEMLSSLADYFERRHSLLPPSSASVQFFQLLLAVSQHQSLMVSIPIMVAWTGLLKRDEREKTAFTNSLHLPLLELSMGRLVRYENLPEDSQDPVYLYLMEDTDTVPERHAFLGNYRRYTCRVIDLITQLNPTDSMSHVLGQTERMLQTLYDGQPPFSKQNYSKHSLTALRVDAHFTVIESAVKGLLTRESVDDKFASEHADELETMFEAWCNRLLNMPFEDPSIRKRVLQLVVFLTSGVLETNSEFMLKVLEHILVTWPNLEPEFRAYNDAIKDLQGESMIELQRLATEMPNTLLRVYDQIEGRVNEIMSAGTLDEKRTLAYKSFLFLIIHRANNMDTQTRVESLRRFIDPVKSSWQEPNIRQSLSSYEGFCENLGLDKAQAYLVKRQAHKLSDWGAAELDAEGLALQAELEERLKLLPLRPTKAFLAFSVEKLDKRHAAMEASYALWEDGFSNILANLLEYLRFAHACHNPENWLGLPPETRSVVSRVLSDRFWQAGISDGSKDDFYARVLDRKQTVEGLASTVRGSIRFVRETAYAIIYCMSRLDMQFYGFEGLSGPLSKALFADSTWLSTHQQTNLLNLARYLVDDCPVDYRERFLPQLLSACFQQMDAKINGEWETLGQQQSVAANGEDGLKEEMKSESILRQVTYTAVIMVADFLDPYKPNPAKMKTRRADMWEEEQSGEREVYPSLRKLCLVHQEIVEPLLIFCTHGIRMRDTRCCSMVLRLFLSLVPEFQLGPGQTPRKPPSSPKGEGNKGVAPLVDTSPVPPEIAGPIREYISTEVLKACITSFHDGYFVEVQKELASLIAAIIVYYSPVTSTPRDVLLQLPNINPAELQRLDAYVEKPAAHTRQQRAIVLDLLKDLKGVSVSEMGKLSKSGGFGSAKDKKSTRSKMAQQFMTDESATQGRSGGTRADGRRATPDGLEGVSNLFDG